MALSNSSWILPEPSGTRPDGKLAVDDAVSLEPFHLVQLTFEATFLAGPPAVGQPSLFTDEMVVFATSNATTFHGIEFGIRYALADGSVYAYTQFPNPGGPVRFHEDRLFTNDGLPHAYVLALGGGTVSFNVDGSLLCSESSPVTPPGQFFVVTTAHRASSGWPAAGVGLYVERVSVSVTDS